MNQVTFVLVATAGAVCMYLMLCTLSTWSMLTSLVTMVYVIYRINGGQNHKISTQERAVLVTGCDTGFGNATARHLDTLGVTVFAGCLFPESDGTKKLEEETSDRVHIIKLDVTSDAVVEEAKQSVTKILTEKKLDLWGLVNNAGRIVVGDAELTTIEQYQDIFNVNTFGTIRVTKTFLPLLRKAHGRVINISSVAGCISMPFFAAYSISKHGVQTFSDVLRLEMQRFKVKVVTINPGNFAYATNVMNKEGMIANAIKIWDAMSDDQRETYGKDYVSNTLGDDEEDRTKPKPNIQAVPLAIEKALFLGNPKNTYIVSGDTGLIDASTMLVYVLPYVPYFIQETLLKGLLNRAKTPQSLMMS